MCFGFATMVIMEAMALRRPVLTTYVAGIPELVRQGENGWLFPAGAVDELVAVLAFLTNGSSLLGIGQGSAGSLARAIELIRNTPFLVQLARNNLWSFPDCIINGTFTVPGDGDIVFAALLDVLLAADYHGWRGTTSTALNFGDNGECVGYLVGKPHQGLSCMFQMMNEANGTGTLQWNVIL